MGGEEVRWKTVRTYGKILATPLNSYIMANIPEILLIANVKKASVIMYFNFYKMLSCPIIYWIIF